MRKSFHVVFKERYIGNVFSSCYIINEFLMIFGKAYWLNAFSSLIFRVEELLTFFGWAFFVHVDWSNTDSVLSEGLQGCASVPGVPGHEALGTRGGMLLRWHYRGAAAGTLFFWLELVRSRTTLALFSVWDHLVGTLIFSDYSAGTCQFCLACFDHASSLILA